MNIEFYNKLLSSMRSERESFITHYKELQEFGGPRRGRFFKQDRNKGTKRHQSIINSVGIRALRTAVAGLQNGTMSPSRPWFSFETFDASFMERADVREWLYSIEMIIRTILNSSNFYNMAPVFLKELILFGTGCMTHVDDFENIARFYTHTVGSYYVGQNDKLEVDTLVREYEWPAIQLIEKFKLDKVSSGVKNAYDKGNYYSWYPVVQFIHPNKDFPNKSVLGEDKAFSSVYYQPDNTGVDRDKFLSKGGFDDFPGYVARWDITEGDIYGVDCPGMTALGDIKQLQDEEKRKAQAIQKMVNPPLSGPPSIRGSAVSSLPGGLVVYEGDSSKQELKPIYQVDPRLQELRMDMDAVERRINSAFFVDLFLAISQIEGIQPRNQLDLAQRNEERLVQLGPVLERIHGEFLTKMVDRVYKQAVKADILPPAPEAIQKAPLRIRFISTLAMAQKAVVTSDIERVFLFGGELVKAGWSNAVDKLDADQAIDEYSRAIGVPPKVVVSDEKVAMTRQQRAQEQQQQQAIDSAKVAADAAKSASQATTDGNSVLSGMLNAGS